MATDIMSNGLRLQFLSQPPLVVDPPDWLGCSPSQLPDIRILVSGLLSRGKIRRILLPQPLFFSRVFLVPKKGGSLRLIIDLHRLNQFLLVPRFKMEAVWAIAAGLSLGLWGCTIDLEDAYHSVPMAEWFQRFLAFVVDGVIYVFTHLPFGLAVAPWAFTRVIRPIKGFVIALVFSFIPTSTTSFF